MQRWFDSSAWYNIDSFVYLGAFCSAFLNDSVVACYPVLEKNTLAVLMVIAKTSHIKM